MQSEHSEPVEETVSLLKYAIAAAIGYYAGQPGGRRQLGQLGQKVSEVVRSPKATELKERGREVVGARASAAVDKVRRRSADDTPSSSTTAVTEPATQAPASADRVTADEIQAAQTGVLPPGPASRTTGGV
jgi:SLT domain-containing protein